jgi:hypothetical protein
MVVRRKPDVLRNEAAKKRKVASLVRRREVAMQD